LLVFLSLYLRLVEIEAVYVEETQKNISIEVAIVVIRIGNA